MKSIMQQQKECFITGQRNCVLHEHHIFGGANRKKSEQYGLKIWLVPELHNMSNNGIHFNKELDTHVKELAQQRFEIVHGNRAEFMRIFGRNWL